MSKSDFSSFNYYFEPFRLRTDNLLFVGCPHLDHAKDFILGPRGYLTVQEANHSFITNWNQVSNEETSAFCLGDTMFGYGGEDKFCKFFSQLRAKEFFCMSGNHYAGFKQVFKKAIELTGVPIYPLEDGRFIHLIPNYFELVGGERTKKTLILSHYPHLSWNSMSKNTVHLFSHVHGNLVRSELGRAYLKSDNKKLEVSVENSIKINNGLPFTLSDVIKFTENCGDSTPDHH